MFLARGKNASHGSASICDKQDTIDFKTRLKRCITSKAGSVYLRFVVNLQLRCDLLCTPRYTELLCPCCAVCVYNLFRDDKNAYNNNSSPI